MFVSVVVLKQIKLQGIIIIPKPIIQYIEDANAACGVKVMITELDVDVFPLTKEGQITGQGHCRKYLNSFLTSLKR